MEYGYVALWLATYLVLGLAALPVAATVFPRFPDRGAAFSIPIALATLGVVGFLVGHLAFGFVALLAGVAVLVGVSLWTGREVDVEIDRRAYAEVAAVFSLAFLFVVAIRAVDPAVVPIGGEKFLDYGLLKSLLRSPKLPPEDMWFAGEPIRYYYAGHLVASLLAQLTFTPARYAYNLALAGFYATLVTGVYGLAGAIAHDHGGPRRLAAGLGAFVVGIASNFYTLGQVVLWLLPNGIARSLVGGTAATAEGLQWSPDSFYYWSASRVIEGTINEFPLFGWLNGDMHAHMMSMGFTMLLVGICYAYWRTPEAAVTRRRFLVFGLLPPLAGFVGIINGWSYPAAGFGLPVLTLALAPTSPRTLFPERVQALLPDGEALTVQGELSRYVTAFALAVGTFALSGVWVAPFWLIAPSTGEIAFLPGTSGLGELLIVHGLFLLAFVPYLARRAGSAVERPVLVVAALGGVLVVSLLANAAAVGLILPVLVVGWLLLRDGRDVGFETMLMIAGAGLVLIVEYAYVLEGVYGPGYRLNTVFKTYAQVWILWAPAAGVALARLAAGRSSLPSPNAGTWRAVGRALTVFLVFSTALYAGFAVPQHFDRGSPTSNAVGPTLDATAFLEVRHPGEAAAIRRIDRLEGQPNIVTAAPGGYRWQPDQGKGASAPASLTGVPTVAGWFHEAQYRSQDAYQQRVDDTESIYSADDPAVQRELLAEYDVEYVYVGPAERARYDSITVQRVDAVSVEGRYGDVVLLEVDQSELN